jgi:protein-L-isoaspartate O-methyltransferase
MTTQAQTADLKAIKGKQQQTWASGDFAAVATTLPIVSELLCEAVDLHAGERVLDVATGSGNTALDAAGQARLASDLLDLARRHNRATDGSLAVPAEYAEVVAVRA